MSARVTMRRVGDLDHATVEVQSQGGPIVVTGKSTQGKAAALHKAAMIAERIANDPVMRAIMPPGTGAAILAIKKLGAAGRVGLPALKSIWHSLHGPGKKRLALALAHDEAPHATDDERAEVGGFFGSLTSAALNPGGFVASKAARMAGKALAKRKRQRKAKAAAQRQADRAQGARDAQRSAPPPGDAPEPDEEPEGDSWEAEQADAQDVGGLEYESEAVHDDIEPDDGDDDDDADSEDA